MEQRSAQGRNCGERQNSLRHVKATKKRLASWGIIAVDYANFQVLHAEGGSLKAG